VTLTNLNYSSTKNIRRLDTKLLSQASANDSIASIRESIDNNKTSNEPRSDEHITGIDTPSANPITSTTAESCIDTILASLRFYEINKKI